MLVRETAGTLSANGATTPVFNIDDADRFSIQLSGTFVATVTLESSVDGVNWVNNTLHASNATSATTLVGGTGFTAAGLWGNSLYNPIFKFLRLRVTAYTSGSAAYNIASFRISK